MEYNPSENLPQENKDSFIDQINPFRITETTKVQKTINLISISFCIILLLEFYQVVSILKDSNSPFSLDFRVLLFTTPLIFVSAMTLFFYKRYKIGWILVAIYLTFSIIISLEFLPAFINLYRLEISESDSLLSLLPILRYLFKTIFYLFVLWTICKIEMREIYKIEKKYMLFLIGSISLLVFGFTYYFVTHSL